MKKTDIIKTYDDFILNTYGRTDGVFVKGKGMNLTDIHGKTYLDFFPGWGVSNVGHCHPKVMAAVRDQIGTLIHIPNNFYIPNQAKLAREIIRTSFKKGKVFFCNSGAEANEAAYKFARAFGDTSGRFEIITMNNSFHGRTLGAMTATGQPKYKQGFGPLPKGFKSVDFNDIEAVKGAVTDKTIAIVLEPVQGEGGVNIADKKYIKELRALCNKHKMLLIFDEVQTGMGRTGEMFAYKHYGIEPDVMILAKALGGGLPIGALIVQEKHANVFKPGMHASTFGGSPLVCKAALGVFKAITADKMLANAKKMGIYIVNALEELKTKYDCIKEVRGLGLMIGIELNMEGKAILDTCFKNGLIINCTQGNVLRFMPALNVKKKQVDKAIYLLEKSIKEVIG